jgi:pimeloyl-ACP methyl ester carboxylesterase
LKIKVGGGATLEGNLVVPQKARGLVIFAHGSGSGRHSPRNTVVAAYLQKRGFGTFLFDMLTPGEDEIYSQRFNISLLRDRLEHATLTLLKLTPIKDLPIGYFGASTGAATAIAAASVLQNKISAIVSRGGRPELVMDKLCLIHTPILFIVGEKDEEVLEENERAFDQCTTEKSLKVIKGATHLFEEPRAIDQVAELAAEWFARFLDVQKDEAVIGDRVIGDR